jgi:serine/threonine-protein kinase
MPSENLAGRTIAGYRLLERVGEGGTAEVYRAEHPERGPCAFKVLRQRLRGDPTAVKRFLREAGYGSRVRHPGVVRTYDYGEAEGFYYLALEWAAWKSLADHVQWAGRLEPAKVGRVVRQLADALGAAHQAGIIHRDLKPENIVYDPATDQTKLLDFGIARDAELPAEERLTRSGFFVGTLKYVAPEALSGELVDGRADIFSLATITYWLLTGHHPYTAKNPRELFQQLLTAPPVPLNRAVPGLVFPPALQAAVMKGLARDPANRQPTVAAFADDVETAIAGGAAPKEDRGHQAGGAGGTGGGGLLDALKRLVGLGP